MGTAQDNWGSTARFGIFIVGTEVVPEAEWWAMAPTDVSVHAARVLAPAPWAPWLDDGTGVELALDLERGAAAFKGMALDAVVMAHTSSSVLGGPGWDQAVITRLQSEVHPKTRVTTNGIDCAHALQAMGVTKPFIVFPPWFGEKLIAAGMAYFAALGFPEAALHHSDAGEKWAGIPPQDLYGRLMHIEQDVGLLHDQIVANCPATADGILIAGTGVRCIGIIDALEQTLQRPVITANQASLWRCVGLAGVDMPVHGYGRLLSGPRGRV
ncbi:MAG: hypothetical protein AAF557_00645 [Pseudomonadota bacterium]